MSDLAPEFLDANTPPDVIVTGVMPPRITDPTLGVELGPPGIAPARARPPGRRLVTIGDSLTHGVTSGAVFHTRCRGRRRSPRARDHHFARAELRRPARRSPAQPRVARAPIETKFGDDISLLERIRAR